MSIFNQFSQFSSFMSEERWFYLTSLLVFCLFFIVWIAYVRFESNRKVKRLKRELLEVQEQVGGIRDRSLSNLQIVRQVIDGFDDILRNMKQSIDDEERKLCSLEAKKKESSALKLELGQD